MSDDALARRLAAMQGGRRNLFENWDPIFEGAPGEYQKSLDPMDLYRLGMNLGRAGQERHSTMASVTETILHGLTDAPAQAREILAEFSRIAELIPSARRGSAELAVRTDTT